MPLEQTENTLTPDKEGVTMVRRPWVLLLAGLLTVLTAHAQDKKDCYVIKTTGERIRGVEISVTSDDGDLLLNVDGKVKFPFKRGSYRFAYVPEPREVETLRKAYEGGQYDGVVKYADRVFEMYKFVGWGDYVAYLEGMSYLQQKKLDEAKEAFQKGSRFPGKHTDELMRGMVLTMLELNETDKVKPALARMITSSSKDDVAFAFNARGRILEKEGKKKEAVLEYLKTLLLFDSGSVEESRDEARTRVVALLKDMNDARWKDFEKMD
jgi:tetratricopeptide (TPR) repeat protein